MKQKVAIAGATGFIGSHLIEEIKSDFDIIALSRSSKPSQTQAGVEWRACDLFSLKQLEEGLEGATYAIYLVHSMLPSAGLTQGGFENLDLIMADNFARACRFNRVRQIIYLGGLTPRGVPLSLHLQSRHEVEEVLQSYSTPVTILRAAMIIGPGGSSFLLLKNLVENLPALALPSWTSSLTQPISLWDTVALLRFCIGRTNTYGRIFDIGMDEKMTYAEMIKRTAKALGKKRRFFDVPFFSPRISKLWVCLFSRAPYALVSPLVDSLRHEMTAKDQQLQCMAGNTPYPFEKAVELSLQEEGSDRLEQIRKQTQKQVRARHDVRSVQRLPIPQGFRAKDILEAYIQWLPKVFRWIVYIKFESKTRFAFYFSFFSKPLLVLEVDQERSSIDRQLIRIKGGLLDDNSPNGRLEFREVLQGRFALAAIHEFYPRIPWRLYQLTQAKLHAWVMKRFSKHLKTLGKGETK